MELSERQRKAKRATLAQTGMLRSNNSLNTGGISLQSPGTRKAHFCLFMKYSRCVSHSRGVLALVFQLFVGLGVDFFHKLISFSCFNFWAVRFLPNHDVQNVVNFFVI